MGSRSGDILTTLEGLKTMLASQFFMGKSEEVALVIAGVHGSELSGIEVARWMCVKLGQRLSPWYTTVIIPELFPRQAEIAREWALEKYDQWGDPRRYMDDDSRGRLVGGTIEPNRQFPRPGHSLSDLGPTTDAGQPVLVETRALLRLIDDLKPARIASLHAHSIPGVKFAKDGSASRPKELKKGEDWPGIFVDPRYQFSESCLQFTSFEDGAPFFYPDGKRGRYDLNGCKFDLERDPAFPHKGSADLKRRESARDRAQGAEDDALAFGIAKAIDAQDKSLVPGNHLCDDGKEVVHYAASDPPSIRGWSLGDWGPVAVTPERGTGGHPGAPVITVETYKYYESWSFANGEQLYGEDGRLLPGRTSRLAPGANQRRWPIDMARSAQLQIYAQALIDVFLGRGP